ncbi:MAG: hypothetical protein JNK60_09815 [Acidobacteria bacterium]|nr:hypothetical protein [Acidobacteriota bacterium]
MRFPGAVLICGIGDTRRGGGLPGGLDARLSRMDRFARAGFLAGARALAEAGREPCPAKDPRSGAVFGSSLGCADAITEHALLVAAATGLGDLRPSVFATTVHNTVIAELSSAYGLAGPAEMLVTGPTAGLEALLLAARILEAGRADLVVTGAAEGVRLELEAAAGGSLIGGGAAFVLQREDSGRARGRILGGALFFEPDDGAVASRLRDELSLLGPGLDAVPLAPASPSLALAGVYGVIDALSRPGPSAVFVRDPAGPVAVLVVEPIISG